LKGANKVKKIIVFVVLLFSMFSASGCSCTESMCSKSDLKAIKTSIEEKWKNDDQYIAKLEEEAMTKDFTDPQEIQNYINQNIEKKIEDEYKKHPKACLTTEDMVDPDSGAKISSKSWKYAFKKGLLEGLIVYPISLLLTSFTTMFGGDGTSKILAIAVTTIIIKCFMLLITFKQQIQSSKMQAFQAEFSEIQKKMSDPHITQNEKMRLQAKVAEIYKKHGINPLSMLISPFISMPIFLAVWSAVNETLAIRSGEFLNIELGVSVSTQVLSFNIGAIILFLLMAALQILSMNMPNILRKRQMQKQSYKDKVASENANNQMKTMMNLMIVLILITGFSLPAAIAVYWTVGAVFNIIQTIVFQNSKVKEKLSNIGNRKKKAKVVQ
jgi:YidC/Oxa1 family membrane protein insertase